MSAWIPSQDLEPVLPREAPLGASAWEEPAAPRPAVLRPALAAAAAALAGSVLWAAALHLLHVELGWLAWGLGLLVGVAAVALGGGGQALATLGAALALAGILGGKFLAAHWNLESFLDGSLNEEIYADYRGAADDFARFPGDPSDEELRSFMVAHRFTRAAAPAEIRAAEVSWFRRMHAPSLREFSADPPSYDTWRSRFRDEWLGESSLLNFVYNDLDVLDLLFALLGLVTAYRIIERRSTRVVPPA